MKIRTENLIEPNIIHSVTKGYNRHVLSFNYKHLLFGDPMFKDGGNWNGKFTSFFFVKRFNFLYLSFVDREYIIFSYIPL